MSITTTAKGLASQGTTKNATLTPLVDTGTLVKDKTFKPNARTTQTDYTHRIAVAGDSPKLSVIQSSDGRTTRNTVKLRVKVELIDDSFSPERVTTEYWEAGVFWNHPGSSVRDTTVMNRLQEAVIAEVLGTFDSTTGVPFGGAIVALNFNSTEALEEG